MTRRRRAVFAAGLCVTAIVAIVVLTVVLSENVVYFRTVSEAVEARDDPGRFRIAGEVIPGTIEPTRRGVRFKITDGEATAQIVHRGDPPDLFKGGAPVVCEGRWSSTGAFSSDRILIKHGSEYTPPDVKSGKGSS